MKQLHNLYVWLCVTLLSIGFSVSAIVIVFQSSYAFGDNKTWLGNTDVKWSTASNWDGGVAPVEGDSLVFGAKGTSGVVLNNDFTKGFSITGITFTADALSYTFAANWTKLSGSIVNNSANAQTINLGHELSGDTIIDAAAGDIKILKNNSINVNGKNLTITGAHNTNIEITVSGKNTSKFIKDGSGTLTLTRGNSPYAGTMTILDGRIIATNVSALGSGTVTNNSKLEFNLATESTGTYSKVISGSGELIKTGAGTLTFSATNAYTGGTTISAGTLALGVADAIIESTSVTNNATITATSAQTFNNLSGSAVTASINIGTNALTLNNPANTSYAGTITATSVNKTGSGTLTLSGIKNFEGATTVSEGTLNLDIADAIVKSTSVTNNAAITATSAQTFNNLSGSAVTASINIGTNALTLNNSANSSYAGTITAASVNKTGSGTLTLSGIKNFEGATTVSEGTLNLDIADAIVKSTSVTNNAAITATSAQTFNNLSGAETTASINIGTNALTLNNSTNSSYAGTITAASVNKTGSGTLTLSGIKNFEGATTVSEGTLNLDIADAIVKSTSVTNNATITATSAQTFNNLSGTVNAASITLTGGDLTLFNTDSTVSKYVGRINVGTGTIRKTGSGTMQLLGASENDIKASSFVVSSGRLDLKDYLTGSLEVETGAEFSPGNSVGSTTITENFILDGDLIMEIESATSYDTLFITGTTSYNAGSRIILNLYVPTGAETLELDMIKYTGIVTGTENWVLGENARYWQDATFSNGKLNIKVNLNAIPEPSTWALLILGALGLMYFRRKK